MAEAQVVLPIPIGIHLPSLNGDIEAGITIGVDAKLSDADKLPILVTAGNASSVANVKQHAVTWAYRRVTEVNARKLFINGIAGLIDVGLICTLDQHPDGDWRKEVSALVPTQDEANAIQGIVSDLELKRAVTVVIATKANFWLQNHHTGQGAVTGYVKKVLDLFYPGAMTDQLINVAHSLGHFASTLRVLHMAEIPNIRNSVTFVSSENVRLKLSNDAKLRFSSMPTGTHRLAISFEAAKRLVRSVYIKYCPNADDFLSIPPIRNDVIARPAYYHIGASYLTGSARADYNDTDCNSYLGRLGTFINTLYKNSTLAKSPHITQAKVESYDDYDADWRAILGRIQAAQATARGRIVEESIGTVGVIDDQTLDEMRYAFR